MGERSEALAERLAEVLWRSAGDDTSVGNDVPMAWSEEHDFVRESYRQSARAALLVTGEWIEVRHTFWDADCAEIVAALREQAHHV